MDAHILWDRLLKSHWLTFGHGTQNGLCHCPGKLGSNSWKVDGCLHWALNVVSDAVRWQNWGRQFYVLQDTTRYAFFLSQPSSCAILGLSLTRKWQSPTSRFPVQCGLWVGPLQSSMAGARHQTPPHPHCTTENQFSGCSPMDIYSG